MKTKHSTSSTGLLTHKGLLVFCMVSITFLLSGQGQETNTLHKDELEEILAIHQDEKQKSETEMLRMKLEMETEKVKHQAVIIILGIVLSVGGASFTGVLYFSRFQIRKKNKLLTTQNIEIQNQHTEIVSQQEEILAQSEQLALKNEFLLTQYQRLEELNLEKDGLIGIVAHDLRTPINQSKGFSELLKSTGLSPDQLILVNMITRVNDDGLHLISDLLQFNSLEHEKYEPQHLLLDQFIHHAIEVPFKPLAERKSIELQIAVEKDLIVYTHHRYLKRILENLVSNALKFSEMGAMVALGVLSTNESVYISVEDQGPGISEEDQKKMFGKFQKLSARPTSGEPSTGLGLAIVKDLVNKLKGELLVKSELGKGTTFILKLTGKVLDMDQTEEVQLLGQMK